MIIDAMERIALYEGILPHAAEIAKLWQAQSAEGASVEIRDKRYDTKPDEKRRYEVHAHTVDLMIGFEGCEIIHICPQEQQWGELLVFMVDAWSESKLAERLPSEQVSTC